MAKNTDKLRWLSERWQEAGYDVSVLATIEDAVHRLQGRYYHEDIFKVFEYAYGWADNDRRRPPEEAWRGLGRLLAWSEVAPDRLNDADSAHLALWAVRDVLGVSAKNLAYILGVSKGRISQFMKPSEPIPDLHRFVILGVLDRAIDEWSVEVKVQQTRQKLIRATRTHAVKLLKIIRDAEAEALFPSEVGA
ncbi:MAG: hypothetical protein O7H40_15525 [Gammaproteobacteria bacterium]|nr:hypothetical protein [Gammaproteobacteria bacterium]